MAASCQESAITDSSPRRELITYTTVVIVFVAAVATIVAVLDLIFAKGVLAVFGS